MFHVERDRQKLDASGHSETTAERFPGLRSFRLYATPPGSASHDTALESESCDPQPFRFGTLRANRSFDRTLPAGRTVGLSGTGAAGAATFFQTLLVVAGLADPRLVMEVTVIAAAPGK